MRNLVLLIGCTLCAVQNSYPVDTGLYHCFPVHSAHLMKQEDGTVSEIKVDTEGVISIIVIDADKIDISDNRSRQSRLLQITANEPGGPIQGQSGFRRFYMNNVLHYFYGATNDDDSVAYAEDGMCSRLSR